MLLLTTRETYTSTIGTNLYTKETYMYTQEINISSKGNYIRTKKPYMSTKETYTSTKKKLQKRNTKETWRFTKVNNYSKNTYTRDLLTTQSYKSIKESDISTKETYVFCIYHREQQLKTHVHGKGLQRRIRYMICIGYFLQKSPIISGSFADGNLQHKASYTSSPLCILTYI